LGVRSLAFLVTYPIAACAKPSTNQPVPPTIQTPEPVTAPESKPITKEFELKYDDGSARDSISFWKGGHIVEFYPPSTPFTINSIRIAGVLSPKATDIEGRTFDLQILDNDLKVIYSETYPYNKFPNDTVWVDFEVPDTKVNDKFYVHIYTESPRYGLHIGADDSVVNKHSDVTIRNQSGEVSILAAWPYGGFWGEDKEKINWMIRVVGTAIVEQ
jgi:hypothetical protein